MNEFDVCHEGRGFCRFFPDPTRPNNLERTEKQEIPREALTIIPVMCLRTEGTLCQLREMKPFGLTGLIFCTRICQAHVRSQAGWQGAELAPLQLRRRVETRPLRVRPRFQTSSCESAIAFSMSLWNACPSRNPSCSSSFPWFLAVRVMDLPFRSPLHGGLLRPGPVLPRRGTKTSVK